MTTIALWLRRLADWCDPPRVHPVVSIARLLCDEQERYWPERSGEAKRHQVYAALMKRFPGESKRVIARAIEAAL